MKAYWVVWGGLLDLDFGERSHGIYGTVQGAVEAVALIGPKEYNDGMITIYRTEFPGGFEGAVPIKRWYFNTYWDERTDNDYVCRRDWHGEALIYRTEEFTIL